MSPRTPKQFAHIRENRKSEILEAALEVFASEGYHSASISSVAKQAGISKGLVYNYFGSKEEILTALIENVATQVLKQFSTQYNKPLTNDDVQKFVEQSIDIVFEDMRHWKLYFSLFTQTDVIPVMMQKLLPQLDPFMRAFSAYFKQKGYKDPIAVMRVFSAMLDGVQMHCILDPKNFPVKKAKKLLIELYTRDV